MKSAGHEHEGSATRKSQNDGEKLMSTRFKFKLRLSVAPVLAFVLAASAAPAFAEEAAGGIEEVVVTAQKRAANIEDVPFSVSATSQQQIINSGSQNLIDLARNIASGSGTQNR